MQRHRERCSAQYVRRIRTRATPASDHKLDASRGRGRTSRPTSFPKRRRASRGGSQPVSEAEIADSPDALCEAHDLIAQATRTAASTTSDDQAVKSVIASNVRLAASISCKKFTKPQRTIGDIGRTCRSGHDLPTDNAVAFGGCHGAELDAAYTTLDEADAKVCRPANEWRFFRRVDRCSRGHPATDYGNIQVGQG